MIMTMCVFLFLCRKVESLESGLRSLCLGSDAGTVSSCTSLLEVDGRGLCGSWVVNKMPIVGEADGTYMGGYSVVPEDNGVGGPLDAGLVVGRLVDVVI